ncbi:lipid A biosynthesis lauroyl acyltransferase [Methylobacterium oxalidis]|uniref:Lipid A biosynthesis lauroyl acyltransferase n=1 Tax=Methylobacterium oxalidis TaxID=944322 RepID=A0A512JCS3_9HYPH|nr:lipid A biosynthesis lauroyl acyltransferase [Methylobacterium oxalidis]GEP07725.1 lipid A biosynthesis lauroyl acyltransferase [Methylobacterium oxalidis]GJE34967.1 Lipid A biosynthesis lauroyltransferase [Methylobacterium oxalidis]GLS62920.1 lipid A biosynthesis lauroyl acyltransferase [Methylobacterium oxalidis]
MLRLAFILNRHLPRMAGLAMIPLIRGLFLLARALGPERASAAGAALFRLVGPWLPAHRTALANLRAAFPERGEAELRAIALQAWENLGRTGAEYAHLDRLFDYDPADPATQRMEVEGIDHFYALRDDGRPGLVFASHLANWELPAICAQKFGLETTAVFRPPNNPAAARLVQEVRRATMGGLAAAGPGAAFAMQGVVERGGHLGQLIDQHFTRGVVVEFFGRPCLANPLLAKLARHYDCPVHGVRVVRKDGVRFRLELTPPLDLPRDAGGAIDVQGAMQAMTRVLEAWVREEPGQWLWMHRRWRPAMLPKPRVPPAEGPATEGPATESRPGEGPAQANVTSQPSAPALS